MKKLLSAVLALVLTFSLAAPALAWESPPAKYADFEEYLAFYRSCEDSDTQALAAFLDDYLAAHADEAAAFDPYAYFDANIKDEGLGVIVDNWFGWNGPGYTEDHFRAEMMNDWLTGLYRDWRDAQAARDITLQYSEDFAAFDADAWFAGYYGGVLNVSKAGYMERENLPDEESFRRAMFAEWYSGARGRFNGVTVTVDGTPVQFQMVRGEDGEISVPVSQDGRILVPARAIAEALGFAIEFDASAGTVTCSGPERRVRFTLGSREYTVSAGDAVQTFALDVPARAENGRTYLPLRALAEALGCTVTWNGPFRTAAITAGQS